MFRKLLGCIGFSRDKLDSEAIIQGVSGEQFLPGTASYDNWRYQYATSTHAYDHNMNPGLIIRPKNKNDIKLAVLYAASRGRAIAIRTGGHQYSGASSTGSYNIQLDLRDTFKSRADLSYSEAGNKSYVRTSVSWGLAEFNRFLGKHKVFVPHGQCIGVHLGGHVQTGGYGQLGRSFGLLGDHVRSLEFIDHVGQERIITKSSDRELFYAWLGGSPGNLGVLTHVTLQVHRDSNYTGARGLKVLHLYSPERLKQVLTILAAMNDDYEFPRNYDLCVSVLSASFDIFGLMGGVDDKMREQHPEIYGKDGLPFWPRAIVIYAQWVPLSPDDEPDMSWFAELRKDSFFTLGVEEKRMSKLTSGWLFRNVREFDLPYVKRTYVTDSTTLGEDGWVDWVVGRIDEIVAPDDNGLYLSAQIQPFGGRNSRFHTNARNGTSYSWRDSTLVCTMDCFHKPERKADAERWQQENDQESRPGGIFSQQDRRLLWGSYGDFNLDAVWDTYYEDRPKYERLGRARQRADPLGTFTPNSFCVRRAA